MTDQIADLITDQAASSYVPPEGRPGKFGGPKPMCQGCLRRVYGIERKGGWWCTNCEAWVIRPKRSQL